MTALYAPTSRVALAPAFIAAVLLHLGIFAAIILLSSRLPMIPSGSAVPITIVSGAPVTNSRPAEPAPETQAAAAETPAPQAPPPAPAPPQPAAPTPAPLKARPTPTPTPAPAKPVAVEQPRPARPALDLDALQASVAKVSRPALAKPAFAPHRGPARTEAAPQARVAGGPGISQSSMQGLSQLLSRLWNPNCTVEGGNAVVIPVSFTIGHDGRLEGTVRAGVEQASSDPVVAAAARRAIDAVHQAEPYGSEYRGALKVIFDAKKACA